MNARSQLFELTVEGRQADEAVSSLFHTVLFHRCLGKFAFSDENNFTLSTVGFSDVDCNFIDLTYVCCSSNSLCQTVKQEIGSFSEQLRSPENESQMGQISLEFFQRKKSKYFFYESVPWEIWTIRLELIALENETERQVCREKVGEHLTEKILYITEIMNRGDFVPKNPTRTDIDMVFDTSFPDVQPYLFKFTYSVDDPSSGGSFVGSSVKKLLNKWQS